MFEDGKDGRICKLICALSIAIESSDYSYMEVLTALEALKKSYEAENAIKEVKTVFPGFNSTSRRMGYEMRICRSAGYGSAGVEQVEVAATNRVLFDSTLLALKRERRRRRHTGDTAIEFKITLREA